MFLHGSRLPCPHRRTQGRSSTYPAPSGSSARAICSSSEIERGIKFIKEQRSAEYDEEILKEQEKKGHGGKTYEKDDMYEEAVKMVLDTKQASVSMLQRRLGLGYTRSARLVDTMEAEGIVGPYNGSKPREILIDNLEAVKAKWNQSVRD